MGGVRCGIAIAITWFLGWIFVLPWSTGWTAYQNLWTVTPREPTWALVPLATLGVSTLFWGGIFNTIEQDFPKYNPTNSPLPVPRNPKLSKVDHRWINPKRGNREVLMQKRHARKEADKNMTEAEKQKKVEKHESMGYKATKTPGAHTFFYAIMLTTIVSAAAIVGYCWLRNYRKQLQERQEDSEV